MGRDGGVDIVEKERRGGRDGEENLRLGDCGERWGSRQLYDGEENTSIGNSKRSWESR